MDRLSRVQSTESECFEGLARPLSSTHADRQSESSSLAKDALAPRIAKHQLRI